jgi:hypothetical protein
VYNRGIRVCGCSQATTFGSAINIYNPLPSNAVNI